MPAEFWLVGYGELVWNRKLQAFVPLSILRGEIGPELFWLVCFLKEDEADAQILELKALGCSHTSKKSYGTRSK